MNDLELEIIDYKYKILKLKKYTKNMTILMVEDYLPLHNNLKKTLEALFEKIDAVYDGKEAITLYEKNYEEKKTYDIVLSDIEMPNVDGLELSKYIKKINPLQNIIILSAHKEVDYLFEFINLGISRFIEKPISLDVFLDELYLVCLDIYKQSELSTIVKFSDKLFYNKVQKVLYLQNSPINLSNNENLIIQKLISNLNLSVSNDELVEYLYNHEKEVSSQNVRKLMYRLRQKLPNDFIQNVHGIGYKIVQQIES
nr:response regulator transcription factor [uncultured Sulfurimonas sp.]